MTTLCRFCRGEDGPNEATTEINNPANGRPLPACKDCASEWSEQRCQDYQAYKQDYEDQLYQDWLAEQGPDEDMSDPAYNSHPAAKRYRRCHESLSGVGEALTHNRPSGLTGAD